MIKINLTPVEELENPFWYVPEVLVFALLMFSGCSLVELEFDSVRNETQLLQSEAAEFNSNTQKIKPELQRFDSLQADIDKLNLTISSLKKITVSRVSRFKPLVIMEHLHNLKPEGMWYSEIEEISDSRSIRIKGKAFDPIIIAEFYSALKATSLQQPIYSDPRTQVIFENVELFRVGSSGGTQGINFPELEGAVSFDIQVSYREQEAVKAPPPEALTTN